MDNLNAILVVPVKVPTSLIVSFGVLVVVAAVMGKLLQLLKPKSGNGLFELRPYLLTKGENAFLPALEQAIGNQFRLAMKVRLGDLVAVRGNDSKAWTARNKTWQKHVDFVLCTHYPVKPVLVIELDDALHDEPHGQSRDAFVDECLDGAGLPILHQPCRQAYDVKQLAADIRARLESLSR